MKFEIYNQRSMNEDGKEQENTHIAGAEMGGLCANLIEEIISRVPKKPLVRMKCISKGWFRFISHYPSTPPSTFFCQFMSPANQERQVTFVDNPKLEGGGREFLEHDFTKIMHADYCLIGSSKRWLLVYRPQDPLGGLPFIYDQCKTYLFNCPPRVLDWESTPNRVGMGVASVGLSDGFKVVAYVFDQQEIIIDGCMEFKLYSPESNPRRWRKQLAKVLNTSATIINLNNISKHIPCLSRKGMLNWILDGYILVYHLDKNVTKLIRLPDSNKNHEHFRECYTQKLWDWNGCLYYSNRHNDKIHIWTYDCGSSDEDVILNMKDDGNWELRHIMELTILETQHPEIFDPIYRDLEKETYFCFEPCGFNGYMQIMYVQLPGMIVCYSLNTRRLFKAWNFEVFRSFSSLGHEVLLHQSRSLK